MISSSTRKVGPFVGDDVSTDFAFTFKIFADTDIYAVKCNSSTEVETVLTLTTDYTVTLNADQDTNPGGTVVLTSVLPTGYTLTISSQVANTQLISITNQGDFYPKVISNALDKATIQIQQLQEQVDRAPKVPISDTTSMDDLVTNVIAVANSLTDVETLADNIADVNTAADNIADISTVADNIVDVSNFSDLYYGPAASDPSTRKDGSALVYGDLYFNTTVSGMRVYTALGWVTISVTTFASTTEVKAQTEAAKSISPLTLAALVPALGAANYKMFMNAGATAPEWAKGMFLGGFHYDISTTGDASITGVGFKPSVIILLSNVADTATGSIGIDDGTSHLCLYNEHLASANLWTIFTSNSIAVIKSGADASYAQIKSFDADGFTYTKSKTGSPTGSCYVFYLALR